MSRWPMKPLGDVAESINGRAFKPSEWSEVGIPIVRIQNLTNPEAAANLFDGYVDDRHAIRNGNLLVSWSATLDVFEWQRGDAALNQHIFKVLPYTDQVIKRYLYYALKTVMAVLRSKTHGATMKHITKGRFEATLIPVPPLAEQEQIVRLLDEADAIRRLSYERSKRLDQLLETLIHEAFSE